MNRNSWLWLPLAVTFACGGSLPEPAGPPEQPAAAEAPPSEPAAAETPSDGADAPAPAEDFPPAEAPPEEPVVAEDPSP